MSEPLDAIDALRGVPMFSRLGPDVLESLADQVEVRAFEAGEVIAEDGSPNDGLFIIADGRMEARRGDRLYKTLGPGDYVGDMSLIDGQPHMVDVVATETGRGLFLGGGSFRVVIKHYPEAAIGMMEMLVGRIREVVAWLEESEGEAG